MAEELLPDEVVAELERGTVPCDDMRNLPGLNRVSIVLLRELHAPTVLTTEGDTINTSESTISTPDGSFVHRSVAMFGRKQTGSERREGKRLMREWLGFEDDGMAPTEMATKSPESVLFGTVDEGLGIKSRPRYGTAFPLRSWTRTVREETRSGSGDKNVSESSEHMMGKEYVRMGTLFPSVIEMEDATPIEVAFVLAVLKRTKSYGGSTSRMGDTRNRILDIYVGSESPPSNKDLLKETYYELVERGVADTAQEVARKKMPIDPGIVEEAVAAGFETLVDKRRVDQQRVSDGAREKLLDFAADPDRLRPALEKQAEYSGEFVEEHTSSSDQ